MKEKIINWLKNNWREVIGWIVIAGFGYIYLFKINHIGVLAYREKAFDFLVITTLITLGWLRLNKK